MVLKMPIAAFIHAVKRIFPDYQPRACYFMFRRVSLLELCTKLFTPSAIVASRGRPL